MGTKTSVGIIGCGNIFPAYVRGASAFDILHVVACADVDIARAQARADEFGLRALSVDDLLASQDIDIVVNLTIPAAHAEVSLRAIEAGKHIYEEKPFAITREDGQRLLAAAETRSVRIGCAPDTFLGGGLQTCRKLIDDGWIGTPVAAAAFMLSHGPESWHPNPDFFYKVGGGPMFDMGPYYLTALIHLLGPVARVAGSARISFPERTATSQALFGHQVSVEIPTHVTGIMDFAAGPVATITTSFDIWGHSMPRIEIYGSTGSLSVPDPNTFGGPVYIRRGSAQEWQEIPLAFSAEVARGIGVADMAYGIQTGRPHRASGQMAYHVLDLMHAFHDSSHSGQHVVLQSTCDRPAPLPLDLIAGRLDD